MKMPTKHIGSVKGNQSHFNNFFIIHCIVDITYTTGRSSPLSSLSELSPTYDLFSFLFEELRTISGELQIVSSSTDSVIEVFLQEKGETFSIILKTVSSYAVFAFCEYFNLLTDRFRLHHQSWSFAAVSSLKKKPFGKHHFRRHLIFPQIHLIGWVFHPHLYSCSENDLEYKELLWP